MSIDEAMKKDAKAATGYAEEALTHLEATTKTNYFTHKILIKGRQLIPGWVSRSFLINNPHSATQICVRMTM
jgi:hypothetical protein